MENPTDISAFRELSTQHQKDHRAKIGVKAESILANFWREDGISDVVRVCEIQGWIDVLETCSHNEIRAAWTDYQRSGPRNSTGRLLKPDAGALWRIVIASRPRPTPRPITPQAIEQPRERVTRERALVIMRETWGQDYGGHEKASSGPQDGGLGALAKTMVQGYGQAPEASR